MTHERVTEAFRRAKIEHRTTVMPYVTAGDPVGTSLGDLLLAMQRGGADIIEIGIPFSDPIADGPVIASAMYRALEAGMSPGTVFQEVAAVRDQLDVALVAMVSMSIVSTMDIESFVARAAESGFDGLIVPDADLDDLQLMEQSCRHHGVSLTPLVAPSSTPERIRRIVEHASGFVYLLARAGVTGARSEAPDIEARVNDLRALTELPVGVGFGISTAEHVDHVGRHADGAIVGSALVRHLHDVHENDEDVLVAAERFVNGLITAQ
ncbi:MAG: tryptophan synthase subunit alpha [Phycisphaerae bacterium]|nr:tryptophan synthase subunit alpha [Phycisphaerae bacterium]HAW96623.1 tryptophan synthase subunit alpha [Phycisphaerales bacterium]